MAAMRRKIDVLTDAAIESGVPAIKAAQWAAKKVTKEMAHEIIEIRKPLGLFYMQDGKRYVGIDNSDGDAWCDDFNSLSACKNWLLKEV
jgi:hypothetical protein